MKVNSYKEANRLLEQVQCFLEAKGHTKDAMTVGSVVDSVSNFQPSATKQATPSSWLSSVIIMY